MTAADLLLRKNVDNAGYFAGTATMADVLAENFAKGPACSTAKRFDTQAKIPVEPLQPGEQYRFYFNAAKCIGCECCVVACNEQNGNPAQVQWRRVGEVEAGTYPRTKRYTLSMSCNHCLDPACLNGCPTDAYAKDPVTGIVRHDAESCIGCQYCIWNCDYGVPQFNEERKIVTKCDMCYGRLGMGSAPACVAACPEEAIVIEKVNVEDWKKDHSQADAPGLPDSGHTLSTTRITLPPDFPDDTREVDEHRLEPEDPHTPLIFMTVLTQLSVGAFFAIWLMEILGAWFPSVGSFRPFMKAGALSALLTGFLALGVSVLHLGRPLYAAKALKMWKRSWLSREVLLFGIFSELATAYAGLCWMKSPEWLRVLLGFSVVLSGIGGILCSGFIYMVPARPSWNSSRTPVRFFLTGLILGPALSLTTFWGWRFWVGKAPDVSTLTPMSLLWLGIVLVSTCLQLSLLLTSLFQLVSREEPELRGTAILLTRRFKNVFVGRLATTALGGMMFPIVLAYMVSRSGQAHAGWILGVALGSLILSLAGEILGRYLFFVTVVPKNMVGTFFKR